MKIRALMLGTVAALAGCTSMSGYDAKKAFACQAPDGVLCESMSGIYAQAVQKHLPGQQVNPRPSGALSSAEDRVLTQPIDSGLPMRSAPRVLRVWFAPWEDSDGDLHDQSYLYLTVDTGHWLIEHNRRRIEDAYRPVRAPTRPPTSPSSSTPADTLQTGDGEDLIGIGARQDRPRDEQAEGMLDGIVQPGDPFDPTAP